jgi:hypothetical protein
MTGFDELGLRNRRSIPLAAVPREAVDAFRGTVVDAVRQGWRVAAFFGLPETQGADARLP